MALQDEVLHQLAHRQLLHQSASICGVGSGRPSRAAARRGGYCSRLARGLLQPGTGTDRATMASGRARKQYEPVEECLHDRGREVAAVGGVRLRRCKIVILSRFVALSVSLNLKASPFQVDSVHNGKCSSPPRLRLLPSDGVATIRLSAADALRAFLPRSREEHNDDRLEEDSAGRRGKRWRFLC